MKCPICNSCSNVFSEKHPFFKGFPLLICKNKLCEHCWCPNPEPYSDVELHHKSFKKKQRQRASNHVNIISEHFPNLKSILEMGPTQHFYFIKKISELFPESEKYIYDIADLSEKCPKNVIFLQEIDTNLNVDIIYSSHSLEHVPNVNWIMKKFLQISNNFLIEVPTKKREELFFYKKENKLMDIVGIHHHIFSMKSVELFFNKFNLNKKEIYTNKIGNTCWILKS